MAAEANVAQLAREAAQAQDVQRLQDAPEAPLASTSVADAHEQEAAAADTESAVRGQTVPIDASPFIPVPPEVLQDKLFNEGSSMRKADWDGFCQLLGTLVHEDLSELRSGLRSSYQSLDPARGHWVGQFPSPSTEAKFASNFLHTAALAGFTPVSSIDLERTRELKESLLSLPLKILWDRLDSRWIERFFNGGTDSKDESSEERHLLKPELRDFGSYALVLKRGVAVEEKRGRLLMQKLDFLQSEWILFSARLLRSFLEAFLSACASVWRRAVLPAASAGGGAVGAFAADFAPRAVRSAERLGGRPAVAGAVGAAKRFGSAERLGGRPAVAGAVGAAKRFGSAERLGGRPAVAGAVGAAKRFGMWVLEIGRKVSKAGMQRWRRALPYYLECLRGIRMRLAGTQVLRQLQPWRYQYAYWLFENVLRENRFSEQRAALIARLSEGWARERELRGQPTRGPSCLPEEFAEKERQEALRRGDHVTRVSLEHVRFSLRTLWDHTVLQEPQFKEIIVVYRLQAPGALEGFTGARKIEAPEQRAIHVRRFWEVPMKDIKMVLPSEAWEVRGRPLDVIKLDLVTLFGLCCLVSRLIGATHGYLVLSPLVLLIIRTFLGHRRTRVRFNSVTSSMLFDRCLDKDSASTQLLTEAAEAQVFAECALAYRTLLDLGGASLKPVDEAALCDRAAVLIRRLLDSAGLPSAGVRPQLAKALDSLKRWGLVEQVSSLEGSQGGGQDASSQRRRFRAKPLAEAPDKLQAMCAEALRKRLEH